MSNDTLFAIKQVHLKFMTRKIDNWGTVEPTHNFIMVSIPTLMERNGWVFIIDKLFVRKIILDLKVGRSRAFYD